VDYGVERLHALAPSFIWRAKHRVGRTSQAWREWVATSIAEHGEQSRGTTRSEPSIQWVEAIEHGENGWSGIAFEDGSAGAPLVASAMLNPKRI
jgi:hypothetical protein